MDERGFAIIRKLMSEMDGAPSPGVMRDELYSIWYEHAQSAAQEALEYLNTSDPGYKLESGETLDIE